MTSVSTTELKSLQLQLQRVEVMKTHNDLNKELSLKECDIKIKINEIISKKRKSTSTTNSSSKKRKPEPRLIEQVSTGQDSTVGPDQVSTEQDSTEPGQVSTGPPTTITNIHVLVEPVIEETQDSEASQVVDETEEQPNSSFHVQPSSSVVAGQPDMTVWSKEKRRAWENKHRNENNFLYHFKPDGEEQKTGNWTFNEKLFFINLINEKHGGHCPPLWGNFSKEIPGRNGLQCRDAFYRIKNKQEKELAKK
jgi:hypothetical protein